MLVKQVRCLHNSCDLSAGGLLCVHAGDQQRFMKDCMMHSLVIGFYNPGFIKMFNHQLYLCVP